MKTNWQSAAVCASGFVAKCEKPINTLLHDGDGDDDGDERMNAILRALWCIGSRRSSQPHGRTQHTEKTYKIDFIVGCLAMRCGWRRRCGCIVHHHRHQWLLPFMPWLPLLPWLRLHINIVAVIIYNILCTLAALGCRRRRRHRLHRRRCRF